MQIPVLDNYRKRKMNPKVFSFCTFAHKNCPIAPSGPFRDNIREFLRECGESESYDVDGMPVWCTFLALENKGVLVPLYTFEECVKKSVSPLCNSCRIAGWNNHFVSKRKYHLIIPVDNGWSKPIEDGVLDLQTHLLHGMIHCNGFGHLLSINGVEGGSKYLTGKQIMNLWDRICTVLRTRKITVEDVSRKRSMDLRLLHGIAYGYPWFGRWNYKFLRGSFGVTKHKYEMAINFLSSLELHSIVSDFSTSDRYKEIKQIVCYYTDLSGNQLITLRDLFKFILAAKPSVVTEKIPPVLPSKPRSSKAVEKTVKYRKFLNVASGDSRWPVRRLEYTANVIVEALKEKHSSEKKGLTRQEARDAARLHIGDTGLIDYVLKSMKNVIVGNFIVSRVVNPKTRVLEFSLKDLKIDPQTDEVEVEVSKPRNPSVPAVIPGVNVNDDVEFLYNNVLLGYPESGELVMLATQAVLNSKVFVKDWPFVDDNDDLLRFFCRIKPCFFDDFVGIFLNKKFRVPPGELILVPLYATVHDLKVEAQKAMRDTYFATKGVIVKEVEGKEGESDDELLFGMGLESGSSVNFLGVGMELGDDVAYEGGADDWTVRCECGAREDDGERMVECDVCEVWHHTRCSGIEDSEAVPPLFVCGDCCLKIMPTKMFEYDSFDGVGYERVDEAAHESLIFA